MRRSTWAMLTAPKKGATWQHLAAELGLSQRTVAKLYAWFIDAGLLARAVPGTTARYRKGTRCGLDDDGRGREAAQYLLIIPVAILEAEDGDDLASATVAPAGEDEVPWPCQTVLTRSHPDLQPDIPAAQPPVERSFTPQPPLTPVGDDSPHHAREARPATRTTPAGGWRATVTPVTKRDRLAACERLRAELPPLRKLSARHLRSLLRIAFDLGATVSDIRHALDHRPDGSPWIHTRTARWPPGWIRHRLSAWIAPSGQLVILWPMQQRAAEHAALLAEQRARRQARVQANQTQASAP
ncbi:hypothetical protein ABT158_03945 [Nonomuraea sp. NPDC001636]|uniref:hypothetical protein n=1 Tax=Nonomuraea sp. NPDC001636 TaxID=3154391 RepID=UPI003318ADB5